MLLRLLLLLRARTKLGMVGKSETTFDNTYRGEKSHEETSTIVTSAGWHRLAMILVYRGLDVTRKPTVGTRKRVLGHLRTRSQRTVDPRTATESNPHFSTAPFLRNEVHALYLFVGGSWVPAVRVEGWMPTGFVMSWGRPLDQTGEPIPVQEP